MTLATRTRVELGAAAAVAGIGAIFAIEAMGIDPRSYEQVGPRAVPVTLALAMIALAAVIAIGALRGNAQAAPPEPGYGFADSDIARVAGVIGAGAALTIAFWAAGYMAACFVGMVLVMRVFGVRSWPAILATSAAAAVAYQFTFMGMMGLLDPRGALLDLRPVSSLVTPN